MVLKTLLIMILAVNGYFIYVLICDFLQHKYSILKEKGNNFLLPITSGLIFFLATFGVSDFAIGTAIYSKLKWVNIKKLPGTVNVQSVIPTIFQAIAYLSTVKIDSLTLIVCIFFQVIGAYIGPRIVVRLPEKTIREVIKVGLILASIFILLGQFKIIPETGVETSLRGYKLGIASIALFCFGALNNIGIGSYAPTFVTVMLLGLSPITALPIMTGAATFSITVGSIQFVKLGEYSRKIVLFTAIFGTIGVLTAVYIVQDINRYTLKWVVFIVLLYAAYSIKQTSVDNIE